LGIWSCGAVRGVIQTGFVSWPVEGGWMRGAGRAGRPQKAVDGIHGMED